MASSLLLLFLLVSLFHLHHAISPLEASQAGILEWHDAQWKDDGSAQIPLGNGDVTAGVWISNSTNDLRILISSSSAVNENSQPVKIGVLRLTLDPPLDDLVQRFDPTTAFFSIQGAGYTIRVYVDANAPLLRVSVRAEHSFSATAQLEPYRRYEKSTLGFHQADCQPRWDHEDTIVDTSKLEAPLNSTVTWYHQNPDNASQAFFDETLNRQGVDPSEFVNPFRGRIFGGSLSSEQLQPKDPWTLKGTNLTKLELKIAVRTQRPSTAEAWLEGMSRLVTSTERDPEAAWNHHKSTWEELWNRSYVVLSTRNNTNDTLMDNINAQIVWDRYLSLIQGRGSHSPLKFNGQAFTANTTGKGWDWRFWGSGYWWQNTRQPYYNSLMQGDGEVLDAMIAFYQQMVPLGRARTVRQFRDTDTPLPADAIFFPETTTAFGTYYMADWDNCDGNVSRPDGASHSPWIRYHYTGGLELSLLILDRYEWTKNVLVLERQLPLVWSVISAFVHRFPIHPKDGIVDIFPAQSLETWQCPDPGNRSQCVTNPTPDIAGLQTVLKRLLELPANLVSGYQRELWTNYTQALPPLPMTTVNTTTIIAPGERLPPKPINVENAELYTVHPYRLYGVGLPDLALAQDTFEHRRFPCNNGWCQDVIDAALLNRTEDTVHLIRDRVQKGPAKNFRFPGFAAAQQDDVPSLDHFSTFRTAVNYMLLSPYTLDAHGSFQVFPGFPSDVWNVEFRLHGPDNTVIEASCQDGEVKYLRVDPPEKRNRIQHTGNCRLVATAATTLEVE